MSKQKKKQTTSKPTKKTAAKAKLMPTGSESVKGKVALYQKTAAQFHSEAVEMVQSGVNAMQSGVRDMQSAIGEQRKKYAEGAAEMIQSGTDAMKQGILAMQAGVRDMQSAIGEQRKKYAVGAAAFQSGVNEMVVNIASMRVAIAKHAQDNQAYIKQFIG